MNPYVLAAILGAAHESQQPRNNRVPSSVRRAVIQRPDPRRESQTNKEKRRLAIIRFAVTTALMVAFVGGLILFSFTI